MKTYSSITPGWLLFLSVVFSSSIYAQQKPQYDPAKGFYDYQKKMNTWFEQKEKEEKEQEENEEEAEGDYEQWKRSEWYYSTRLGPAGKLVNMQQLKLDALRNVVTHRNNDTISSDMISGSWSQLGPTSISGGHGIGRINRLGFLNSDANMIYAATAGGGLWRTTTGGTSWFPLTDGLPNMNLQGVAVHQTNPDIIYILTGDGDGGGPGNSINAGKYSTGVLKTIDAGVTWTYTGLKWNETDKILGYELIMHPTNFNILMVASSVGIYRSTNGGTTWTNVLPGESVYDIEFMPNNPLVVYAGTNSGTFYRSMDQGANWVVKYNSVNPYADRVSVAVTPDNSSDVYMLISNNDSTFTDSSYTFNGIYYSPNMGEAGSWIKKASKMPDIFSGDGSQLIARQHLYNHSLVVSPFDNNKVLTGAISMFRSTDGGTTLNFIDGDVAGYHVDVHELVYGPTGILFAATDGGFFKSTNDGTSWTMLTTNLTITQYYRISVSDANSSHILGGAQDNGSHFRASASTIFQQVSGKDGTDNAISRSSPSIMYTATNQGDFLRSSNSGSSFSQFCNTATLLSAGIGATFFWITPIQVSPTSGNKIFMGYMPVVKGVYSGTSWTFTNIGTEPTDVISGRTFLQVAPSDDDVIYAGDNNYNGDHILKLWRTTDGGGSWNPLTIPFSDQPFTALTINPDDPNDIWLTYGGYEDHDKVFKSTNGGTSWSAYSGSLPNVPVNCIIYDDNNGSPADALYIGTDIGVFYRDNSLGDWIPFSNGLPVVEVTDLDINETAGLLRAGTYGRGIWQTSLYDGSCVTNLTLSGSLISEPRFISASSTITSTTHISGAGAHVQYKAGQRITLNPGFRIDANSGAKHMSYIGPCPGGGVPPVYLRSAFNRLPGYLKE